MSSHVIKVTGIPEELLILLDRRIQDQHSTGRAEYIRELIRRDLFGNSGNVLPINRSPNREEINSKEWRKALRQWIASLPKRKTPPLSDEAVRRENMYRYRG